MPSKLDRLREGQAVEVEPGVHARLNKENKRLELSTGETLNVADNTELFPTHPSHLAVSREKEQIQRNIGENPLGEFGYDVSQKGLLGSGKDWLDYATAGENYVHRKQAQQQVSQDISETSPWTSRAGTAASLVPDLAVTRGMSGVKAAPLLIAGSAGSRLLTEPGEVAKEAAVGSVLGKSVDIGANWINGIAARRGASRTLPQRQEQTVAQNALGQRAHNVLKNQELQEYHGLMNQRQNEMIEAQNAYKASNEARDASITELKNAKAADRARIKAEVTQHEQAVKQNAEKYKIAVKEYKEAVENVPKLQAKAQQEHSQNVVNSAKKIESAFPENAQIHPQEIGVNAFIDQNINKTGLAGSKDGRLTSKMLRSLFPEKEALSARELSKRYQALEEAIQRGSPETQKILREFKQHLGGRLQTSLENNIAFKRLLPAMQKGFADDVRSVSSKFSFPETITASPKRNAQIVKNLNENVKNALKDLNSETFIEKINEGTIFNDLIEKVAPLESFLPELSARDIQRFMQGKGGNQFQNAWKKEFENATASRNQFIEALSEKMNPRLARYQIDSLVASEDAIKKLGGSIKGTFGVPEAVPHPIEPQMAPNPPVPNTQESPLVLPDKIPAPQAPPQPIKPAPPPAFVPHPPPTLNPAQSFAESAGDLLEKPLLGGRGLINNPVTKLAGLKYLFGKAALPAEAAYLGLKGLTSPTAGGEAARLSFKQFGVMAIERLAQKYPSYHDGILEDPRERRSLAKEIEDDYEIPLEQKALYQSKINRGKPLNQPI